MNDTLMVSPKEYVDAAIVAQEAGQEILSRLDFMSLSPNIILEVGSGAGELSALLKLRYRDATVISLDHSESMLNFAAENHAGITCVCADGARVPLQDQGVDLILAHFMTPWYADVPALFQEWRRLLRPNGVLMLTALGPDTLKELHPFISRDEMPSLIDMHDIGDMLLHQGFDDPVVDVNYVTLAYREKKRMTQELQASGMWLSFEDKEIDVPLSDEKTFDITHEILYAHAFAPPNDAGYPASSKGVVEIPLASLRAQLKSR